MLEIEEAIDDMNLSCAAFRAYLHLAKVLNGKTDNPFPTIIEMGEHCFPNLRRTTAQLKMCNAIKELRKRSLIQSIRMGPAPNVYMLNDKKDWK